MLLSIAVLTVCFDRCRYWITWWRAPKAWNRSWEAALAAGPEARERWFEDREQEMAFGEPLLRAAAVLAPLLGLIGTVIGLMKVLTSLGPQLVLPAGASLQGYGQVLLSTVIGLMVSFLASATLFANEGLREWQLGRIRRAARRDRLEP